jgi:ketosteroid isomerase-like protein
LTDRISLLETSDKIREALFANDVKALDQLMADEYVGYDPLGNPQDKAMSLEAYQAGGAKLDKYDVEDVEARVIGEVGIVSGKGHIHGTFSESEFEHDLRFLDLYIHREGRWQLYLSQVTPLG